MNREDIRQRKVLFVTFEYKNNISGGIGTCLNGLAQHLSSYVHFDIAHLVWSHERGCFQIIEYKKGTDQVTHESNFIKFFIDRVDAEIYTHIHFVHSGKEILEIIEGIRSSQVKINIVYSCHSIFKHEQNIRCVPLDWVAYEQAILAEADIIHVLNETCYQWLVKSYSELVKQKKIVIIPNGVEALEQVNSERNNDAIKEVICLSRWAPGKGIEIFLDAQEAIRSMVPEIKVTIAGRDPNPWDENTKAYVEKIDHRLAQLPGMVNVLGWQSKESVQQLIGQADVCVMPSELEYFPYAFLEPCMRHTPVVCSRLDTINELFTEDEHFLGFDVGDSECLASQVVKLLRNPALAQSIACRARTHVLQHYNWEKISKQYCNLYSSDKDTAVSSEFCKNRLFSATESIKCQKIT